MTVKRFGGRNVDWLDELRITRNFFIHFFFAYFVSAACGPRSKSYGNDRSAMEQAIEVDSDLLRLWGPDENSIASALASPRLCGGGGGR